MEFKFLLPTKIPPKYILLFWGKNGRISGIQNEMNLQTVTSDLPHVTFMYVRQNCATVKSLNNV